ncbi:MAG TPA: PQQ-binding-like beta-propeller repeat protein [Acidimicrobiales bacterium]|nr:PQQ-binding-like beta-propeller repeat protein [Acidimicrobiales bacterium]
MTAPRPGPDLRLLAARQPPRRRRRRTYLLRRVLVGVVALAVLGGIGMGAWLGVGALLGDDEPSPLTLEGERVIATLAAIDPIGWPRWADPVAPGTPLAAEVDGLLTFRGNASRSFHGTGPVPAEAPAERWSYPASGALCSSSTDLGSTRDWCGLGWTGQPAVVERDDRTWVVFGAYDGAVHFVDGDTGESILPPFPTGDLVKGSVAVDPDGFPIVYVGSRDDHLRAIAIDGDAPRELWRLSARDLSPGVWNDDWDPSPLVIDDVLLTASESGQVLAVRLNRAIGDDGLVRVRPTLLWNAPAWDAELLTAVGDAVSSVETSVTVSGDVLYHASSAGLVQGWDLGHLALGVEPTRVFRYWAGDDIDASVVADDEGMLYVGVEFERLNERSRQVGQVLKLDPSRGDDPLVWSVPVAAYEGDGVWGTPAVHRDIVIAPTDSGRVLGIDRATGEVRWELSLFGPLWSSPAVVDDVLLQGDCGGTLHAFDLSDTAVAPPTLWSTVVGGCIEATPAVWEGRIYVGTRAGQVHALG